MTYNSVYSGYVTSATFCMKLSKNEIATLATLSDRKSLLNNTSPAFWSLAAKGLTVADGNLIKLSAAGECAVKLLAIAGLVAVDDTQVLQAAE